MKSIKLASAAAALVLSASANAAIISYSGYTHDTDTDIVTGNGLEWLQWDRTVGQSINSIQSQLHTLEGGGWSVASNTQMAQLFNAFDFGLTFDNDENTRQVVASGYTAGDTGTEADELFISMFGDTYAASGYSHCNFGDCFEQTLALFGNDPDADGYVNVANVYDDYRGEGGEFFSGTTDLLEDHVLISSSVDLMGVALVREVSAVPVPAAVWLFGSGLIGLVGIARRNKV